MEVKITCKIRHPQFTDNKWLIVGVVNSLPKAVALYESYYQQPHIMTYSEEPGAVPFELLGTITAPIVGEIPVLSGQALPVADGKNEITTEVEVL